MGTGWGNPVFKIPNRSDFLCSLSTGDLQCTGRGAADQFLILAAALKNGTEFYGNLQWDHFVSIMGSKNVGPCDERDELLGHYITPQGVCLYPEVAPGLEEATDQSQGMGNFLWDMMGNL